MFLRKFDLEKFHSEYNVRCRDMYPCPELGTTPFGATWAVVEPGGQTKPHSHEAAETFFIVEGRGQMDIDGDQAEVRQGDVVYLPPGSTHVLYNLSVDDRLLFLSVFWDEELAAVAERMQNGGMKNKESQPPSAKRRLIISAPPTPNGKLHLGHLSGPYLAADVYRRYSQLRGVQAFHLCGSDDHQSYVQDKAHQLLKTPSELADELGHQAEATLRSALVPTDMFLYPRKSRKYSQTVQAVFDMLLEQDKVVVRDSDTLYSEKAERYLYGVWVMGGCPHCGAHSMGNYCEACGLPNDCVDLVNPVCSETETTPVVRTVKRAFFPLEDHRESLKAYFETMRLPLRLRAVAERLLRRKRLPDVAVSHPSDWGIPVPRNKLPGQIISVWMEMVLGYLYSSKVIAADQKLPTSFWEDPDAEVVQFFGNDNAFFYTMLFPAVMKAVHADLRLPHAFCTNEHYQFEGKKFSTSRQHAIWVDDSLEQESVDVVRFYLCHTRPEQTRTTFTHEAYQAFKQVELQEVWSAWLTRLEEKCRGVVPEVTQLNDAQSEFYRELETLFHEIERSYESERFSLRRVTRLISHWVHAVYDFGCSWDFLDDVPRSREEREGALALELAAARSFAFLLAPIMPNLANRLWKALGHRGRVRGWPTTIEFLPPGQSITGLSSVIPKLAVSA